MNLKLFILGLCVLVSIAQVQSNAVENAELNEAGKGENRTKRGEQLRATIPVVKKVTIPAGRRFNPMEAIGNLAKQPMKLALKEAMNKLFASYTDKSKPFGPTYDTTWGSPAGARKMDTPVDEMQMQHPTPAVNGERTLGEVGQHDGNFNKQPNPRFYKSQMHEPTYRSFGHSLQPALPYQSYYDNNVNGKMYAFSGPSPGYFPHNPYDQQQLYYQNRRSGSEGFDNKIMKILKDAPKEIEAIIHKIWNVEDGKKESNVDNMSMRNGFMGDVYQKGSSEDKSDEEYTNTQVEFDGSQADAMIGNRRYMGSNHAAASPLIDKLLESSVRGLAVIGVYLKILFEEGTPQEIGERLLKFKEVLKKTLSSL